MYCGFCGRVARGLFLKSFWYLLNSQKARFAVFWVIQNLGILIVTNRKTHHRLTWYKLPRLWRWQYCTGCRDVSNALSTTVLFRSTLTGMIIFHLLLQFTILLTIAIISHQAPAVQKVDSTTHWITQWAFSEFSRASESKRGSVQINSFSQGCALGLILKVRLSVTRKWPIGLSAG